MILRPLMESWEKEGREATHVRTETTGNTYRSVQGVF